MVEVKNLKKESNLEGIPLELPQRRWGVRSHLDNIEYCIEQIRNYSRNETNNVIGYNLLRTAMGTTQTDHRIISEREARRLKTKYPNHFSYNTLDDLLRKKRDIEEGKYEINSDGHIVGPTDSYLEEIRNKLKSDKGSET